MKIVIKRLTIRNFRLFDDIPRTFKFDGGFTQIIANNGKGKTSLWLALKIGLTGNIPREMGRKSENGVIHFPQDQDKEKAKEIQENSKAEIVIVLNNEKENGFRPFYLLDREDDEITIKTVIPANGKIKYYVNGKNWDRNVLRDVLSKLSINPNNPFLFLEQNKTTSLIESGPIGLMEALEDSLGIKEIRKNLDDALNSYEESKQEYNNIHLDINKLKSEVDLLKIEYDRYQKFTQLISETQNHESERISRIFYNICGDLNTYKNDLNSTRNKIQFITEENQNYSDSLIKIDDKIKIKNKKKNEISDDLEHYLIELGKSEEGKKKEEKNLDKIQKELETIDDLKKINKFELKERKDHLESKYLKFHDLIKNKDENIKVLDEDIRALEKGKSIGPENSQKFLKILKDNDIPSELLINTIELYNSISPSQNILETIQLFESIVDQSRWAILIFGNRGMFNEAIKLAKKHYFNNFLIQIETDLNEADKVQFQYRDVTFIVKYKIVRNYLNYLLREFEKLDVDSKEGLLRENTAVKFFKLDPTTLKIDRVNRLNEIKQEKKRYRDEIKELRKEFKTIKNTKEKISKQINELEKINEEEKLNIEKAGLFDEIENLNIKIKNHKEKQKIFNKELKNLEDELTSLTEEKTKNEIILEQNSTNLNESINVEEEITQKISSLENKKSKIEKEDEDLISDFPNPREVNILDELLKKLRNEIKLIGEIKEEAVKDYDRKFEAFKIMSKSVNKAYDDLQKKIEDVKNYQEEFKNFIDKSIKQFQKNFSTFLNRINYDGRIMRKVYRFEGRRRKLKEIEELPDLVLDKDTIYGIDIKMKKPEDRSFVNFFDRRGKVSSRHSGGQKALMMLAYLLAIQKTIGFETNFYIFDEPTPQLDEINNTFILKLFSEIDVQIILLTPNPMPPDYFDEIIAIIDQKIKKIPSNILNDILQNDIGNLDSVLKINKNDV
ncbi:MAG: AAA family ATPase [Candidatus Lokiarchaeia archaeon]